jgi:hypothetical protein
MPPFSAIRSWFEVDTRHATVAGVEREQYWPRLIDSQKGVEQIAGDDLVNHLEATIAQPSADLIDHDRVHALEDVCWRVAAEIRDARARVIWQAPAEEERSLVGPDIGDVRKARAAVRLSRLNLNLRRVGSD